jgi:DNA polymerase theta
LKLLYPQVMPYVSLCAQKAAHLQKLLEPLGREVKSLYGGLGGVAVTSTTGDSTAVF